MSAEVDVTRQMDVEQNGEVSNGNVLTTSELTTEFVQGAPVKEGRVIRKAKRIGKPGSSPRKSDEDPETANGNNNQNRANILPFSKNSRKSRIGKGRGLPKKGGGGGKGVWGKPGSELFESPQCQDSRDPNYDSDTQDKSVAMKAIAPVLTQEEVSRAVEPILHEYLEHGDTEEVAETLEELRFGNNKHKVTELAINLALDRHAPQREMTSRLISDLYGRFLTQEEMAKGFDEILQNLEDLTLDAPEAPDVLGQFIARAVADDCLPPKFVKSYVGKVDSPHIKSALDKADVLLSMKHGIVRLDNVWGVGGGNRPVKYLSRQIVLLLKEYISSGDVVEATRCLTDLDVPHYHHEMVYEAAVIAIEDMSERSTDKIVKLLKHMCAGIIITPTQMDVGVLRVFENMPDICLDVPEAYGLLERLADKLHNEKVMSEELYKQLPVRGRKRFVSEGDGGKLKTDDGRMDH